MIAANERTAVSFRLSPGQAGDAPEGRKLLLETPLTAEAMNKACEGDETWELVVELGSSPEVSPKSNRKEPWDCDKEIYRLRNEVEPFRTGRFRSWLGAICSRTLFYFYAGLATTVGVTAAVGEGV